MSLLAPQFHQGSDQFVYLSDNSGMRSQTGMAWQQKQIEVSHVC